MKQASFYLVLLLLTLLTATTAADAQLMRKDTASLPRSKWEVGFDLKPIWDQREPYNFVVRYFFQDRWALRGGVGLELNESKDTFRLFSLKWKPGVGLDSFYSRYGLTEIQMNRNLSIQAFIGIQYESSRERLRLYHALDLFFTSYRKEYGLPLSEIYRVPDEAPAVISDFTWVSNEENTKIGGGIRLINGFRYRLLSNLSASTEMAFTAQGIKYENLLVIRDASLFNDRTFKQTIERGWSYSLKVEPLFRVFINYHFFKNSKS